MSERFFLLLVDTSDNPTTKRLQGLIFVKFLQPGTGKSKAAWWVPLTFTDPETGFLKDRQIMWLKPKEAEKHLSDLPDSNTPVIFNINQTGFYRFNLSLLPRNFIAIFLVMETWVQLSGFPW